MRELTMMNDAVLQQSLSKVDPFLWFAYLPDFYEPRYKLTTEKKQRKK